MVTLLLAGFLPLGAVTLLLDAPFPLPRYGEVGVTAGVEGLTMVFDTLLFDELLLLPPDKLAPLPIWIAEPTLLLPLLGD